VIDGQTDGQNYDSQDRASIAASRGKNENGLAQKIRSESWSVETAVLREEKRKRVYGDFGEYTTAASRRR